MGKLLSSEQCSEKQCSFFFGQFSVGFKGRLGLLDRLVVEK